MGKTDQKKLRFQSKYGEMQTRKDSVFRHFSRSVGLTRDRKNHYSGR